VVEVKSKGETVIEAQIFRFKQKRTVARARLAIPEISFAPSTNVAFSQGSCRHFESFPRSLRTGCRSLRLLPVTSLLLPTPGGTREQSFAVYCFFRKCLLVGLIRRGAGSEYAFFPGAEVPSNPVLLCPAKHANRQQPPTLMSRSPARKAPALSLSKTQNVTKLTSQISSSRRMFS
jgi:hypothetical protein